MLIKKFFKLPIFEAIQRIEEIIDTKFDEDRVALPLGYDYDIDSLEQEDTESF